MADHQIVIAGFGGQGLLFAGKVLAHAGLIEGRELSWLPSYGPEMRGGTANCNVILSDTPVGSPIVQHPNALITRKVERDDVEAYYVPATQMATDMGYHNLANMILLGKVVAETGCIKEATLDEALHHVIPARKASLFDVNKACIEAGKAYAG